MNRNKLRSLLAATILGVVGCSGGDEPAPGTPAEEPPPPNGAAQEAAQEGTSLELLREEYSYRGSSRDPFQSLIRVGGEDRPRVSDIRLTSILYDAAYPARSVAVVRDTVAAETHRLGIGAAIGRLRVVDIRPREVVVAVEEFGTERQVVLALRSLQEDFQ